MNLIEKIFFEETKNNQKLLNKIKIIISFILLIIFSILYVLYKYKTIYYILLFLGFYITFLIIGRFIFNNYFKQYKYYNVFLDIVGVSFIILILINFSENLILSLYIIPFLLSIIVISGLGFQKLYTIIFGIYSIPLLIYLLIFDNKLDIYSILIIFFHICIYLSSIYSSSNLMNTVKKISYLQQLEKFSNSNLVEKIVNNPLILNQKGEKKELVIFFLDIRGFSKLSEKYTAKEVFKILNIYLGGFSSIIEKNKGIVDKYIGDCIMCYFEGENMIINSYKSYLEITKNLEKLNKKYKKDIGIGIGIHFGEVFSGAIGNKNRLDFTIIGDNVNIASRLESKTRDLNTNIVVSKDYYNKIDFKNNFELTGTFNLKGKNNPIDIYIEKNTKGLK